MRESARVGFTGEKQSRNKIEINAVTCDQETLGDIHIHDEGIYLLNQF